MTVASDAKPLPLMVMLVPPVVLPVDGATEDTFRSAFVGLDGESPQPTPSSESAAAMRAAKQVEAGTRRDLTPSMGLE